MTERLNLTRRDTLRLGVAGAAALAAAPVFAEDNQAEGVVFVDRDGSGRAAGNPGLAGALVSNGREVVATDAQGRWRLPAPSPCVFFVIKPPGYMPQVDAQTGSPRFYYLHSPEGSPAEFTFAGIAPTGPLPASIDFGLKPQAEPDTFEVVLF